MAQLVNRSPESARAHTGDGWGLQVASSSPNRDGANHGSHAAGDAAAAPRPGSFAALGSSGHGCWPVVNVKHNPPNHHHLNQRPAQHARDSLRASCAAALATAAQQHQHKHQEQQQQRQDQPQRPEPHLEPLPQAGEGLGEVSSSRNEAANTQDATAPLCSVEAASQEQQQQERQEQQQTDSNSSAAEPDGDAEQARGLKRMRVQLLDRLMLQGQHAQQQLQPSPQAEQTQQLQQAMLQAQQFQQAQLARLMQLSQAQPANRLQQEAATAQAAAGGQLIPLRHPMEGNLDRELQLGRQWKQGSETRPLAGPQPQSPHLVNAQRPRSPTQQLAAAAEQQQQQEHRAVITEPGVQQQVPAQAVDRVNTAPQDRAGDPQAPQAQPQLQRPAGPQPQRRAASNGDGAMGPQPGRGQLGPDALLASDRAVEAEVVPDRDLTVEDDGAAVAAFLLRIRHAAEQQQQQQQQEEEGAGDGHNGTGDVFQLLHAEEASLPEVEVLELQEAEEGMVDAGDGLMVSPATAGPGITYRVLWKPEDSDELFPAVLRGLRTRPTRPLGPLSAEHLQRLRAGVPRRRVNPGQGRRMHPAAVRMIAMQQQQHQLLALQQQQMFLQLQQQQEQQQQLMQQHFLVQPHDGGQPVLVALPMNLPLSWTTADAGNAANALATLTATAAASARSTSTLQLQPSYGRLSPEPVTAAAAAALARDGVAARAHLDAGVAGRALSAPPIRPRDVQHLTGSQRMHNGGGGGGGDGGTYDAGPRSGDGLSDFAGASDFAGLPHPKPHTHPHPQPQPQPHPRLPQHSRQHQHRGAARTLTGASQPQHSMRHHPYHGGPVQTATAPPYSRNKEQQQQLHTAQHPVIPGAAPPPCQPTPRPPRNHRGPLVCTNCGTTQTPLWRKDRDNGLTVCNACGIYKQTHGVGRPVDGRTEAPQNMARYQSLANALALAPLDVLTRRPGAFDATFAGGVSPHDLQQQALDRVPLVHGNSVAVRADAPQLRVRQRNPELLDISRWADAGARSRSPRSLSPEPEPRPQPQPSRPLESGRAVNERREREWDREQEREWEDYNEQGSRPPELPGATISVGGKPRSTSPSGRPLTAGVAGSTAVGGPSQRTYDGRQAAVASAWVADREMQPGGLPADARPLVRELSLVGVVVSEQQRHQQELRRSEQPQQGHGEDGTGAPAAQSSQLQQPPQQQLQQQSKRPRLPPKPEPVQRELLERIRPRGIVMPTSPPVSLPAPGVSPRTAAFGRQAGARASTLVSLQLGSDAVENGADPPPRSPLRLQGAQQSPRRSERDQQEQSRNYHQQQMFAQHKSDSGGVVALTEGSAAGGGGGGGSSALLQHLANQVRLRLEQDPGADVPSNGAQQQPDVRAQADNPTYALVQQLLSALQRVQAGGDPGGATLGYGAHERDAEVGHQLAAALQRPSGRLHARDDDGRGLPQAAAEPDARLPLLQALQQHRQQQEYPCSLVSAAAAAAAVGAGQGQGVQRTSIDLSLGSRAAPRHQLESAGGDSALPLAKQSKARSSVTLVQLQSGGGVEQGLQLRVREQQPPQPHQQLQLLHRPQQPHQQQQAQQLPAVRLNVGPATAAGREGLRLVLQAADLGAGSDVASNGRRPAPNSWLQL